LFLAMGVVDLGVNRVRVVSRHSTEGCPSEVRCRLHWRLHGRPHDVLIRGDEPRHATDPVVRPELPIDG
jgi:hypothetical protein